MTAKLLMAVIAGGVGFALLGPAFELADIEHILRRTQDFGVIGWLMFLALQIIVALSGILPASLLGIAAGAVYGAPAGFALAAASTLTGGWLAFLASRSLLRPTIERLFRNRPRLHHIDARIGERGWRMVLLLRLSPAMPFSATSYLCGLSRVRQRDYLLGTLASLPALAGYVVAGSLADASLSATRSPWHWAVLALGLAASALLTLQVSRIALHAR
jgi:uncharacterized membrane protein YdjX (TVP38/TMEM64 family)